MEFGDGGEWYGNFPRKSPESPRTVDFLKREPFNRKFWKFREQSGMGRKFSGRSFLTDLGVPPEVVLLFWKFLKMPCSIRYWKLPKIHARRKF